MSNNYIPKVFHRLMSFILITFNLPVNVLKDISEPAIITPISTQASKYINSSIKKVNCLLIKYYVLSIVFLLLLSYRITKLQQPLSVINIPVKSTESKLSTNSISKYNKVSSCI